MCVDDLDRDKLVAEFTLEEIRAALFKMKHNKASAPDGFPVEFYQHFRNLLREDLLQLFNEFLHGRIDFARLNYGVIALIPKCSGADMLKMYIPICMSNVSVKLITKVINNRTVLLAPKIIAPVQIAFTKNRYILEGVVVLREVLHEIHRKER